MMRFILLDSAIFQQGFEMHTLLAWSHCREIISLYFALKSKILLQTFFYDLCLHIKFPSFLSMQSLNP